MNLNPNSTSWLIEERLALLPVIGRFVRASLRQKDLGEQKIEYGAHPAQYALLFWPEDRTELRRSAIIFLHGGGWSSGNPQLYRFVGQFLACLGYPTLLGGYRLAPEFTHPTQMEDVYAGLEAGLMAMQELGMGGKRIIVGGISAGAHLASLLVFDRDSYSKRFNQPPPFAGLFSISGPLNFSVCTNPSLLKMIDDYTVNETNRDLADAIHYIRGDEQIPALFIHGDKDQLVDVESSFSFARQLARGDTSVEVHLAWGSHHADLATMFLMDLPETRVLKSWLDRVDRGKGQ